MRRRQIAGCLVSLAVIALLALSGTAMYARKHGLSVGDLWQMKKGWIKDASPAVGELVDAAEEKVKKGY